MEDVSSIVLFTKRFTRSLAVGSGGTYVCCFFGDIPETETSGKLHQLTTFELDSRVRSCAHTLQDAALIAKLSAGDMITTEAHYHAACLVELYKRAAAAEKSLKLSE